MNRFPLALLGAVPLLALGSNALAQTSPAPVVAPLARTAKEVTSVVPVPVTASAQSTTRRLRPHRPSPVERGVRNATRAATREPMPAGFVNAVQIYPFADGTVYQVYTAPERVSDIALQPGETLISVAAGDTVRWVIGDTTSGAGVTKQTHVLVKPFSAGLATNVIITTERRSYHLALISTAGTAMVALSWTYPQDALIALKRAADASEAAAPVATGIAPDRLHFDYTISGGRPAWRPLRAFDDGRQTYIEFPASLGVGEAPPLFLVDAKSEASLVNYRLQGRFYVVDRLFDIAELRLGLKRQEIVRITRASGATRKARS